MSGIYRTMTERFTIAYTGSVIESALTLNRPLVAGASGRWSIQQIQVYSVNAGAGGFIQVFRKDSGTTAAEQDVADANSVNVQIGSAYLIAGNWTKLDFSPTGDTSDMSELGLRTRIDAATATSHTIYLNVTYFFDNSQP